MLHILVGTPAVVQSLSVCNPPTRTSLLLSKFTAGECTGCGLGVRGGLGEVVLCKSAVKPCSVPCTD
jgi:hypothetical protein